ncbi:hypothetical protein Tco_0257794 [Tanacetum coccineum]
MLVHPTEDEGKGSERPSKPQPIPFPPHPRRKSAKLNLLVLKITFDKLDDDEIDYMETEDAQDVGRTRYVVHEEKKSAEKEVSTEDALNMTQTKNFDDIKARIKADRLLALRLQEGEREQFTMKERAKFLHDTIAAQRRFLAIQRVVAIRLDLLQMVLAQKSDDERKIKEMNEGASDPDKKKKFVKEDVSAKVPAKQDVAEQGTKKRKGGHMKMLARKRKDHTTRSNRNFRAFNYLLEVLHIFDRQDLFHLYDLVMKQYSEVTLEGIELILWGDLKIMMESSTEENDQSDFWNNQQNWEIVRWRLYEACGVYILELEDGTVIHMLVERRYPLSKDLLQRMLDFGLEVEVESTAALDLIRFIKQQLNEE